MKRLFFVAKIIIFSFIFGFFSTFAEAQNIGFKFDFGAGKPAVGYTQITEKTVYGKETNFGFEPGANVSCVDRGGKNLLRSDFCTADKPFYFSVAVPEGNYKVTVTFGDKQEPTATTVKAELRRLMIEKAETKAGKFLTQTFIVNVRAPQISSGGEVRLKEREKTTEWWAWDEKLTLEFNNSRPVVNAIEIERADVPTVYLLGDSTVADQPREPYNSWGQMLTAFFKPETAIANHAESGESLKSSLGARRLDKVLSLVKPGDFLIIQYGHNDEKDKSENAVATYKANLKRFAQEARKKGASPVLVTPMHRLTFDSSGKITNSHGDYLETVRQAAKEENVPLIRLDEMSKSFYEALGTQKAKLAFKPNDPTHHSNYGSYELAKMIVQAIKNEKIGLAKYLMDDLPKYDPSRPAAPEKFAVPASPLASDVKPLGS